MKQLICSVNESSNKSESWTHQNMYWNLNIIGIKHFFRRKHVKTLYKKNISSLCRYRP